MRLSVTLDHRFAQTPTGEIWSSGQYPRKFWDRYLDVFEEVNVVARVQAVDEVPSDWPQADGPGVSFSPVPYYAGPREYLLRSARVRRFIRSAVRPTDAVMMRVPSQVAACLEPLLKRRGQPYAVEVVDDPFDRFSAGTVSHPLRPIFQWVYTRRLRQICTGACGAAYVTQYALQRRYPCPAYTTSYSSIELNAEGFADEPPVPRRSIEPARIITVGTLANPRKGVDVLLEAISLCVRAGIAIHLTIVGDGAYRQSLEGHAADLKLDGRVQFTGQLASPEAVRALLREADLFVLASLGEGVPRAMIEAMALGLPCIGTAVGGIPELLAADALVEPANARSLADRIMAVLRDPIWLERQGMANLAGARAFRSDALRPRRDAMYRHVRAVTDAWLQLTHVQRIAG